jgi:acyl-CoA reductase-like NAD-dependent aldehyde dehydrogenase
VISNVIDGQLVPAHDGGVSEVVDPSTGKVYDVAALSTAADVDAAYTAAALAAGNTVVLKPSDTTPATASLVAPAPGRRPMRGRRTARSTTPPSSSLSPPRSTAVPRTPGC